MRPLFFGILCLVLAGCALRQPSAHWSSDMRAIPDGQGGYGIADRHSGARYRLTPQGDGFTLFDEISGQRAQVHPDGMGGWRILEEGMTRHLRGELSNPDYIRLRDQDTGEVITLYPDNAGGYRIERSAL